ncbi:MAG: TIGR03915 family putative DNA repair protein [Bacteroidota bacterium]|nr:TIGR03915 family putative DNA repair protein [Bacteroidota bacterium]
MSPIHFQYDGSFAGLLTASAEAVRRKVMPLSIVRAGSDPVDLFATTELIVSDQSWSDRVWRTLIERYGKAGARDLAICHLAELHDVDHLLLQQIKRVLEKDPAATDPRDPVVNSLRQWHKKIDHEVHHMHAFVRFQENSDGLWTSTIAPAYDVLPLIAPHFSKRFADMRWMIFDQRRNYALHFNGEQLLWAEPLQTAPTDLTTSAVAELATVEDAYQTLWKTYFHHVNIPERANLKLQMQHMAKRHWRHMVEMVGS